MLNFACGYSWRRVASPPGDMRAIRGWLQNNPEIAEAAGHLDRYSYDAPDCAAEDCDSPARYHGRCYAHWREAMTEQQQQPALPASDAMTEDQQREVIQRCRTRKEACVALGLYPRSLGALDKRCMRLGVKPRWLRLSDPAAGLEPAVVIQKQPITPRVGVVHQVGPVPVAAADGAELLATLKAVEALVVILRQLPAEVRQPVVETALRMAG